MTVSSGSLQSYFSALRWCSLYTFAKLVLPHYLDGCLDQPPSASMDSRRETEVKWQLIEDAPHNQRLIVSQDGKAPNDECAMAWLDRIDDQWYYAPQGGVLYWKPTHWMPLPAPPVETGD